MSSMAHSQGEGTNRSVALIGTIVFHALILLFLIWYVIITPIPPYPPPKTPEVEVAVDFGNNINGSGNVEQPNKGNNNTPDNTTNTQNTAKTPANPNSVVTNNTEETTTMNNAKHPGKVDKVDTASTPHESLELASALNKFKHAKGQPGGNGNTNETGNAGSPDGKTPGTSNGNGGTDYSLNGRNLLSHPIPVNVSQDQGKVVVEITVDPDGNVVKAVPGAKGSTTSSSYLFKLAKQAALNTKFSKSNDPNTPQQEGTMTIVFVIQ